MINFYHRFIPSTARVLKFLYSVSSTKTRRFKWDEERRRSAFEVAKEALIDATILHHSRHPVPSAALTLSTDVSSTVVGDVLEQEIN